MDVTTRVNYVIGWREFIPALGKSRPTEDNAMPRSALREGWLVHSSWGYPNPAPGFITFIS